MKTQKRERALRVIYDDCLCAAKRFIKMGLPASQRWLMEQRLHQDCAFVPIRSSIVIEAASFRSSSSVRNIASP